MRSDSDSLPWHGKLLEAFDVRIQLASVADF